MIKSDMRESKEDTKQMVDNQTKGAMVIQQRKRENKENDAYQQLSEEIERIYRDPLNLSGLAKMSAESRQPVDQ